MGNNDIYLPYGDGCHRKQWNADTKEWIEVYYSCFTCPFPDCIANFHKFNMTNIKPVIYKHYFQDSAGRCYCSKCGHSWDSRVEINRTSQCPNCSAMLITERKFINKGEKYGT
jgi:hypothetical protein